MPRRARAVPLPWLRVDASLDVSLERQIAAGLRQAIRQGMLQHGFRLPSVRQLALDLGVSRRAVAGAFARLRSERYIDDDGSVVAAGVATRPGACSITASARSQSMPARAAQAPLAPGSVAIDAFPWKRWWQCAGDGDLRQAIADHVCTMRGIAATADEIVLVSGHDDAVACVARLLADPGDLAIVETPGDLRIGALYSHCGVRVHTSSVDEQGLMLDRSIESPRLIHVTPRQWPTGTALGPGRAYLLLQWARSAGAAIVEDDRDGDGGVLKSIDREGCVVSIGTFDKALFPDPGAAFLVVPRDLAPAAERLCTPPAPSPLHEFIASGELARHVTSMRALYEERCEALTCAVQELLGGAVISVRPGAALDLLLLLAPTLDDRAIAASAAALGIAPVALSDCSAGNEEPAPALVVGYGAVTARNARVAVELLARATEETTAARRRA